MGPDSLLVFERLRVAVEPALILESALTSASLNKLRDSGAFLLER